MFYFDPHKPRAGTDGRDRALRRGVPAAMPEDAPPSPLDPQPMTTLHLDDLAPGQVYELGRRTLGRDEIVAFAREWDPQPFHLDEQAAAASIYGGLIASGWHTVCVFMRLYADGLLVRAAAMGSPGVDELRWLKPVRPGDTLAARLEVLEVRPSRSKPDRGIMRARAVTLNQDGDEVLSFIATLFFKRRPAATEGTAP